MDANAVNNIVVSFIWTCT